ncbi:predicted protein [Chaetomium globosum CBS 148.51]|uniref:DUF6589 domain-containing protein n=1 Tax=Chaetomium globosum (strain ATCC 6205 / CBS 148.51 / DSM 1962 / NBRC 6347 / NRRL 1970) TaxID=306901 RepID=Q2GS08_CHAGB|nr:uncharacterized protein CHGG_09246 [Chaetomium globosum CBS 148.51]EAQ85232.1 predicted protein [Chaetomium globosum CBS 148.51]
MAEQAKKNLKKAAHDPNGVIFYDNFNFKSNVRELVGGKQAQMINLTTASLVGCPELNGPLKQSSLDTTQPFTREMVIKHLLPRRKTFDKASKWLMEYALLKVFGRDDEELPTLPVVRRVTYKESPCLQIGAIFEDEGTLAGVYRLHEELWLRRLEFKEYDERLTLVFGDQKSTSFNRRIQQQQLEASQLWERKKWMLPVPAFFHVELNYIHLLFRVFWDTGGKDRSSATISADVQFFQRSRHINKQDIKYHQVLPLLMHGYTSRITAMVIQALVEEEELEFVDTADLTVDKVKRVLQALDRKHLKRILKDIWKTCFTYNGWTGKYDDFEDPDDDAEIDIEFRSHCRLLQCVEVLLIIHEAVRQGDYGLIKDIIPMLPLLFWGGRGTNYGPEMLYFAWLLHPNVSKDEVTRNAILKGGLVRCTTAGSMYKAIDLMQEHIHAGYAHDVKTTRNSTHDIEATFSRLAVNGAYLATIRKSVETVFGRQQKGTHAAGDPATDIISYACKLYKDGMPRRAHESRPDAFDAPDLWERGQRNLLKNLDDFNDVIPEPKDAADQRSLPGVGSGPGEIEIDWADEGERLFDVDENDFWVDGLEDLGAVF